MTNRFTATVLGTPRIGPRRELKKAVESYWAGRIDAAALAATARTLREQQFGELRDAGLDSIPVNTFSYYDHVLDTAVLLGALPARFDAITDDLDRYFAAARGNDIAAPLEMTKWFDTNYHYLVPEVSPNTTFSLHPEKVLAELNEALALELPARPVLVGPVTFLLLSKPVDGSGALLDRLDEIVPLYVDLLAQLKAAGAQWVQIDEPALVGDLDDAILAAVDRTYRTLAGTADRPAVLVASYFGDLGAALPVLAATEIDAVAVDLVAGVDSDALASVPALADKLVVAGVVDGRNIWRTDLDKASGHTRTGRRHPHAGRGSAPPAGRTPWAAVVAYDDHRLLPTDIADPYRTCGAAQGRDRPGRVRAAHAGRDRRYGCAAGEAGYRRAGARRAGAQRHGAVFRRTVGRVLCHRQRLGPVVRFAVRAAADPVR